jgi:serine O-acetyltransferase
MKIAQLAREAQRKIRADSFRLVPSDIPAGRRLAFLALHPGFRSLVLQRAQEAASEGGWPLVEQFVLNVNHVLSGAEFRPGCRIGPGAIIRHPAGIVVGSGVSVGANCTIQHGVTLGEKYIDERSNGAYPQVGDNVAIGTHAVLVGGIQVGDGAVIGALSFVDKDVAPGSTVRGNGSLYS